MKILFAPSEGKREGGVLPPLDSHNLLFPELHEKRLEVLRGYEKLILNGDDHQLFDLFGLKDPKEYQRYKESLCAKPTMKAIERYNGVAYDYLNYTTLREEAQRYIDDNVVIFSNLFGPIRANDPLPDYRLKQGSSIGSLAPEKFYKAHFTQILDNLIGEEEVLDIRAGFYDKFYVPKQSITTLKFLKEGKTVSHWAKAYRGKVLRELAIHQIDSISSLLALNIESLNLLEIVQTAKKKEIIYEII